MGSVYLVADTELDRQVALKVPHLSPEAGQEVLNRFYREARVAARLDHPNLCPVYDVGQLDGTYYLTMPYIKGRPLSKVIDPGKPVSQRRAARLIRKLALALSEAHRRGVVHRDLKPANIIVRRSGELVIMDFGLALWGDGGDTRLTRTGTTLGTPAYMAPEQVETEPSSAGPACDVYSLGVIFYELLAGRRPFNGPGLEVLLRQILVKMPDPPSKFRPDLDPKLELICLKALAKTPGDRHASMAAFAEALRDYLAVRSREAGSPTPVAPLPQTLTLPPEPSRAGTSPPPQTEAVATAAEPAPQLAARLTNSIAMTLVRIEPGSFMMGSTEYKDEKPPHTVRITKAYYLGKYQVTQGQYREVMGMNPSRFTDSDDLPVEKVSWFDAVRFCNKLSEREHKKAYYEINGELVNILGGGGYRLPTEAEWEYACRAGSASKYPFGDDEADLGEYAWFSWTSGCQTHPVGHLRSRWGLHDMLGNVWEWCQDGYDAVYYRKSPAADPPGPPWANSRVLRGGAWNCDPGRCRPACRLRNEPGNADRFSGFRLAATQAE
jgi:formylglycine-generating enzyme required for sulfatase activity